MYLLRQRAYHSLLKTSVLQLTFHQREVDFRETIASEHGQPVFPHCVNLHNPLFGPHGGFPNHMSESRVESIRFHARRPRFLRSVHRKRVRRIFPLLSFHDDLKLLQIFEFPHIQQRSRCVQDLDTLAHRVIYLCAHIRRGSSDT